MIIAFSLFVALVGVLMYLLCQDPKRAEIGRIAFFAGLLAFLLRGAAELLKIIGG